MQKLSKFFSFKPNNIPLLRQSLFTFTGKTQSKFKYKCPKMRMKNVRPVPPPGQNLQLPSDWSVQKYFRQIGGDCQQYADKFQTLQEVFAASSVKMKKDGIPTIQRKYILRIRQLHKRGLITFEYLSRRTCVGQIRDN